jgi:hypothetical protein
MYECRLARLPIAVPLLGKEVVKQLKVREFECYVNGREYDEIPPNERIK